MCPPYNVRVGYCPPYNVRVGYCPPYNERVGYSIHTFIKRPESIFYTYN